MESLALEVNFSHHLLLHHHQRTCSESASSSSPGVVEDQEPCHGLSESVDEVDFENFLVSAVSDQDWPVCGSPSSPAAASGVSFDSLTADPATAEEDVVECLNWSSVVDDDITDQVASFGSMELDPMASLFAFNATCSSPACNHSTSRSSTDYAVLQGKSSGLSGHHEQNGSKCPSMVDPHPGQQHQQQHHHEQYTQPNTNACSYKQQTYSGAYGAPGTGNAALSSSSQHHFAAYSSSHHQTPGGGRGHSPPRGSSPVGYPRPQSPGANSSGLPYGFYPGQPVAGPGHCHGSYEQHQSTANVTFPAASMSVNLSMNMTMGFTAAGAPVDHSQIQWSVPATNSSANFGNQASLYPAQGSGNYHPHHHGGLHGHQGPPPPLGPHHPYPTQSPSSYTFTAEFRPEVRTGSQDHTGPLPPIDKEFPGIGRPPSPPSSSVGSSYPFRETNSRFARKVTVSSASRREEIVVSPLQTPGGNNLCRICGKTYARPSTLKTHLRTHSGERPYRCSTCNKSFSQAANLTAHIRTHSGEKPFRCAICDRRFSQSSSVTTHMRTHSGERPYRCCMCKKAFSDSSTLTKHLRIHSGEKPYQCKLCFLRFSQSGNLNRHMRIHSTLI